MYIENNRRITLSFVACCHKYPLGTVGVGVYCGFDIAKSKIRGVYMSKVNDTQSENQTNENVI